MFEIHTVTQGDMQSQRGAQLNLGVRRGSRRASILEAGEVTGVKGEGWSEQDGGRSGGGHGTRVTYLCSALKRFTI